MCILQPFSPLLFSRGPPQGPAILLKKLQGEYTVAEALEAWQEDATTENSKAKDLDPMAQKYRCMSCHLQKKPSNRPLEDFGITDRKRFYADFMTQGCWRRCVSCATAKNLPIPGPAVKLRHNPATGQESSNKATKSCIRCAEKFPGLQIQVNNHVCSGCRREFPRNHWTAKMIEHHRSPQKTILICKECTASGCTARDANVYNCDGCQQKIGHMRFDKHELYNVAKTGRSGRNILICGYVANSCSTMTR